MRSVILVIALLAATSAGAGEITVSESWARATAPGQDSGAVYLHIISQQDARIVEVTSPVADSAAMHSMTHDKDVMRMRELETLLLPAGKEVALASGGNHIMLSRLKKPLVAGDTVPLTLTIQFTDSSKKKVQVSATVVPLAASSHPHQHQH